MDKTTTEIAEELWDDYSELIGDTIDELETVAGSTIMRRKEFYQAMDEYSASLKKENEELKNENEGYKEIREGLEIMLDACKSSVEAKEKEIEYWKQRCLAAEEMFKCYQSPIQAWNYEAVKERWQQLKNQEVEPGQQNQDEAKLKK